MPTTSRDERTSNGSLGKFAPEVILSIVLIASTIFMEMRGTIAEQTTWIIGVMTATIGISTVILKIYFSDTAGKLAKRYWHVDSKVGNIGAIMEALSGKDFDHANLIVDEALQKLQKIPKGSIPLDETAYFLELLEALRSAPNGCHVLAVNSINIARWEQDPRQKNWLRANADAIKRGVSIHRVFLIENAELLGDASALRSTLLEHVSCGVHVSVVRKGDIHLGHDLHDDFVMFGNSRPLLFIDESDPHDPTRVLCGEMVTNQDRINKHKRAFETLLASALDQKFTEEFLGRV